MKILTALQMADVDRLSSEIYKIPSILLMENAGRSVAQEVARVCGSTDGLRAYVFCGKGNNGGDGFVAARHLVGMGVRPEVFLFADPGSLKGDALANWEMVHAMGLPARILATPAESRAALRSLNPPRVVIDALFGTGLTKPIGPEFRPAVKWINGASAESTVVSVDIPSGLFADSAAVPGPAVQAHLTVTFTALKLALVLPPAADHAGEVIVAPIGSPGTLLENAEYRTELIDDARVRRVLPPRPRESHKGTFGHLYVLAGSRGKSGAAIMTGHAALRSGAGLVTLLLPEGLQRDIVGKVPELMTEALPQTAAGTIDLSGLDKILSELEHADALVIGPGLTTQVSTRQLVQEVVQRSPVPVVVDADGVNAFASKPERMRNQLGQAVSITPHPGEMARLLGTSISQVQARRSETALHCAMEYGCSTVLKGFQTLVATPEGRLLINSTGNPGMATGGSGDILAGMAGRFVAGWKRKFHGADLGALGDCLAAAVYLHGLAGDMAADEQGQESLIATDLLACLPHAFKSVFSGSSGSRRCQAGISLR